ncbi:MAG TPA: gamma-glutamyltransferase [Candidatus Sulfotelmatobacter sp.]|jgi:gamma-glutamyltranspeptidase/glutathione hydrolase|nr:gamma-glutamyltransferase [Candidatus Sulfotelmatobacter sp.]
MKFARPLRVWSSLLVLVFPLTISTFAQNAAEYRERSETEKSWPKQSVRAAHGMVATDEELASHAGVEILQKGGNALDAAVATAFALAVVEPAAGNIGGGGFMLVRLADGRTTFFDYREVAPGRATRAMYIRADGKLDPEASTLGYKSVAVPGTVAGLELALKTYGTMKLADVMAPAIQLAENGFAVSPKLAAEFAEERKDLQRFSVSRRIFLKDGAMFHTGDTLKQPELAATLKRIAKNGAAEFYRGETARVIADDMVRLGGLITLEDLANYQPKMRETLRAHYEIEGHKWDVIASPPPSSGGVAVIEALNMLEGVPLKGWDDAESVHVTAEVMRRVFADRAAYLADPDFARVPVDGLTSSCYAKELRATIDASHASSSKTIHAGQPHVCGMEANAAAPQEIGLNDGPHTTHFSVVDTAGNAVASTFTLNDSYGSHVTSSAGFLLNDEMDDFTTQPGVPNALFGLIQSEANAIAPGHRPLSSMTPTILVRDGKLSFVTGSPGGPRIISAVLLSVINWMRLGMEAQAAINAPRFHHQWLPDRIVMENQFSPTVQHALDAMGHTTRKIGHIGLVNAIGIDVQTGERLGAADPRDEGSAVGY